MNLGERTGNGLANGSTSSQLGIPSYVGVTKLRASHRRVAVCAAVLGAASAFASPALAETPPVPAVPVLPDTAVHRGRSPGRHAAGRYADAGAGSPRTGAGRNANAPARAAGAGIRAARGPGHGGSYRAGHDRAVEAPAAAPALETPAEAPEPAARPACSARRGPASGTGGAGRSARSSRPYSRCSPSM